MKDGIKRMIHGLEDECLGVFGSLRESKRNDRPDGDRKSESLRSCPKRLQAFGDFARRSRPSFFFKHVCDIKDPVFNIRLRKTSQRGAGGALEA